MQEVFLFDLFTTRGLFLLFQYATVAQMLLSFVVLMVMAVFFSFVYVMRIACNDESYMEGVEENFKWFLKVFFVNIMTVMVVALFLMAAK